MVDEPNGDTPPPEETKQQETPPTETPPKETPETETKPGDKAPEGLFGKDKSEEKPADKADDKPVEPLKIEDLKLPEGIELAPEAAGKFTELANELKLPAEGAQRLLDMHVAQLQEAANAPVRYFNEMQANWVTEVKRDPEIGGENFETMRQTVAKVFDNPKFADPKVREALEFTGAGNNPAIVRTLYRMSKALSEGSAVNGNPSDSKKSAAEVMYPTMPANGAA